MEICEFDQNATKNALQNINKRCTKRLGPSGPAAGACQFARENIGTNMNLDSRNSTIGTATMCALGEKKA